jgi:hypothetical protein
MDSVARAAGTGGTITLAGKTYTVKGRTKEYQGILEAEIVRLRGDPISLVVNAAKSLKGDLALLDRVAGIIADRFRNWGMADHSDFAEFNRTPRGQALSVWLAIKHNPNCPDVDQIQFELGEIAGEGEVQDLPVLDEHTGEPVIDKKTGKPKTEETYVNTGWKKIAEIIHAIDLATGEDPLGNSTGPS